MKRLINTRSALCNLLIFTLANLLISTALSAQQLANSYDATRTDWQKMNLKGNVKTLKTYLYTAQKKNGKVVKQTLKPTPEHVVNPTIAHYSFSPEGYLTSEAGYSHQQKELYRKTFQYNAQQELQVMEVTYFQTDKNKEEYSYQGGQLKGVKYYINGEHTPNFDAKYLKKGNEWVCESNTERSLYQYSKGKLLKKTSYVIGGSRTDVTRYTYNSQGQLSTIKIFTGAGASDLYDAETRQYLTTDAQGNPTLISAQHQNDNGETTYEIYEYEITYY